jgi:hypothetical protein
MRIGLVGNAGVCACAHPENAANAARTHDTHFTV